MQVLKQIAKVEPERIQAVLEAIMQRYDELFPDWEINFFSIPKSADRNAHIDQAIRMLQSFKKPD